MINWRKLDTVTGDSGDTARYKCHEFVWKFDSNSASITVATIKIRWQRNNLMLASLMTISHDPVVNTFIIKFTVQSNLANSNHVARIMRRKMY